MKWILLIVAVAADLALAQTNCGMIKIKNHRSLTTCTDIPTTLDWKYMSGNATERLSLNKLKGGVLKVPDDSGHLLIQQLSIKSSQLEGINENFFAKLGKSLNEISLIDVELPRALTIKHFEGLSDRLTELKISNGIDLHADALTDMRKLTKLTIEDSPTSDCPNQLPLLLRLGLTQVAFEKTRIQTCPWSAVVDWYKTSETKNQLVAFSMRDSPLHCDETARELIAYLKQPETKLIGFKCNSPEIFKGKLLKDISPEMLAEVREPPPELPKLEEVPGNKTVEPGNVAAASSSMIAVAVLGGLLFFVIILILAAVCVRKNRSKKYAGHTAVKTEPSNDDMVKQQLYQPGSPNANV